jgi:hypothetical protein
VRRINHAERQGRTLRIGGAEYSDSSKHETLPRPSPVLLVLLQRDLRQMH